MAPQGGTESAGLNQSSLGRELARRPYSFEFFQAVRLLERLLPGRRPVGRFHRPSEEVARFGAHPALSFPASQVQSLRETPDHAPFLAVNFMGLTGPLGVLPHPFTELVLERTRARDTALRDFLDIFHHRIISLFYQAWEKYRFTIAYERGDRDRFSHHLLDLIGLGTAGLQDRQAVRDDSLLYYCGLLSLHTRSAAALRQIVEDYFEVPAEVEQFVGAWHPLEIADQCALGEERGGSDELGWGAVVGDEIFDRQSGVRIRIGPLHLERYRGFLPGGGAWKELNALARFFCRGEFDVEVQLVLRAEDVPACEVGQDPEGGLQLGWTTWIRSAPFARHPDDTVLQLR